jgi:hypothetical protein
MRKRRSRRKKVYSPGCHHTATAGEKWRVVVIITAVIYDRCVCVCMHETFFEILIMLYAL